MHRTVAPVVCLLAWSLTALGVLESAAETSETRPDAPNIVLVVIDDLNHDLGFSGAEVQTPHLDRLAMRGMVFTNAHANAPVCNPSRTSMLLGQYPPTVGVRNNNAHFRELSDQENAVTLPQYFRHQGYRATGAGKIFHSGWHPEGHPRRKYADHEHSWDEYAEFSLGTPSPRPVPNDWHDGAVDTAWGRSFWWASMVFDDDDTGDWKNANYIARYLDEPLEDQPMFLACGIFRPHLPFVAPQKYFDLYDLPESPGASLPSYLKNDTDDLPPMGKNWARVTGLQEPLEHLQFWDDAIEAYRASTTFADACLGQVLDAYDRSPARDQTYLIVTSDHGFQLGEKGAWTKFSFWERSTRVPMIIVGPGIEPGVSPRTVSLVDLYPTLIALAGLPPREGLEGRDFTPLLDQPEMPWDNLARVFHTVMDNEAVIDEDFRYIRYVNGDEELYDRKADPHDWHNLAQDPAYADQLERYRDLRWFKQP